MTIASQAFNTGFEFVTTLSEELNSGKLEIPAFPDVALRIKNALKNPDVSAEHVARVVGSDPIFTARLLKVANSAMINGAGVQINDVRMAITRMGFKMAYNTAVAIAVDQVLHAKSVEELQPYLEDLWRHSIHVGAFSYVIANKLTSISPDEAMLAGLVHDIGKYYILTRSEMHPILFNEPDMLKDIMQKWHTGVGRGILEAWGFSEQVARAADKHEMLDRVHVGPPDLTDVVIVANLFAHRAATYQLPELDWEIIPALKKLNLTTENALEIIEESEEEIRSIVNALQA